MPRALRLSLLFGLLVFTAGTALAADCAGTHQIDRCLVGKWTMTTNGMEQWMRTHIRNFHVTSVSQSNNTITLNADGSFATGASNVTVHGASARGMTGTGQMAAQANGTWSAADGKFNICAQSSAMNGTATVTGNGHSTTTPLHPALPPVSSRAYSCSGNTFTVTTQLHGDNVQSVYTKTPAP